MKKTLIALVVALVLCLSSVSGMACTAIYVGSNLTSDNSTLFARSEDISNSYNKLFYCAPAGQHKAGEVYTGCYGFTYTFTKDSYSYTAFSDDNGVGVEFYCPDCGSTHAHTPYQAGGTNEMGLSVSATETLHASDAVTEADPYNWETGIEEAEIPTVLLSECATAKEAVLLLTSIYDTVGCQGGSGIFIGDHSETWYIENTTGSAYIALKLTPDMAFAVPNQSVIGLIDLDDTENVIASANLIEVAKTAGTFVGDEEANTIDYLASYNADQVANGRMISAMAHFNAEATAELTFADYAISNVDAEGNVVPMYTNIALDRVFTVQDIIDYYDIDGIGSTGNLEIHIFQTYKQDDVVDTIEWVAMDNGCYSVFVPYFPMLTTDTYAAYQLSTAPATFSQEEPTEGLYYPTTARIRNEAGERVTVEGFKSFPENWADSFYWTFDALSNLCLTGATEEEILNVEATLAKLQSDCFDALETLKLEVAAAENNEAAAAIATEISMNTAAAVHAAAVELVNGLK
ncbi:MAG: C69 family dipeptidase [Eubacteriales bacterium]|nr:C69 family dipeptidase [Eubacteriales bacterium]